MLQKLKQQINSSQTPQTILAYLTKPLFSNNLTQSDLKQLVKLIEEGSSASKIDNKVMLGIYSLIMMKESKCEEIYNAKIAIQNLTKYYRTLSQDNSNQGKNTQKAKNVIAALLIRIPTFSNYKLIIRDLTPKLVPSCILLKTHKQIKKQCPNLYQQQILKKYRQQWTQLVIQNAQICPLEQQFKILQQITHKISKQSQLFTNLLELEQELTQQVLFMCKRISLIKQEFLDIEKLCDQIDQILFSDCYENEKNKAVKEIMYLPVYFEEKKNSLIRNCKEYCLRMLGKIVKICRVGFFRKIDWLTKFLKKILVQDYRPINAGFKFVIQLIGQIMEVFGLGIYDFQSFLYTQPYSIYKLLQALCFNNYSKNNKKQTKQMNFQKRGKNKNIYNTKNLIQINIDQGCQVQTYHQQYLLTTNYKEREYLFQESLKFCIRFYSCKKTNNLQEFSFASQFLNILQNSKNKLSEETLGLIDKLKQVLYTPFYGRSEENFQGFCSKVFENYIKKRLSPNFQKQRVFSMFIQPTKRVKKEIVNNNQSDKNIDGIRHTKSFDMIVQGWNDQKNKGEHQQNNNEMFFTVKQASQSKKQEKQIFYSIQEHSKIKDSSNSNNNGEIFKTVKPHSGEVSNLDNNKNNIEEQDNNFLLTPQF